MAPRTIRIGTLLFFLLAAASAPLLHAQQWVELMLDGQTNIHTVKQAFDAEWDGRPYMKGRGWKQFQRWYWFNEQRSYPSGERIDPNTQMLATEAMRLMATTDRSDRDDPVWVSLGPTSWNTISYNPGNGRVNTVYADPSDGNILYAGTPSSGLWRSTDNGGTWQALFTDLPSMGVSGIAIDSTTNTIYIATGDGDGSDTYSAGVLKSTDDGMTWEPTGLNWNISQTRTTRALRIHPTDPAQLYCATSSGLYRTQDTADSWQQVISGSVRDVEFMYGDTTLLFACTDQLYRSVANGTGFTGAGITGLPTAGEVGRMAIAVTPADPLTVYVLCSNEDDNSYLGLYRSTDGGSNFTLMSDAPNIFSYEEDGSGSGGQAWYDMALAVDPVDPNTVYVGGINVWKSIDGGTTWEIRSHWVFPSAVGYTHADIHSLDIIGDRLFCGSDGGLHVSNNSASSWVDLSESLDIMQFYRLGSSELLPTLIMAGAQDNGTNRLLNGEWTHVLGADGMEAAVDPFDPFIVYGASQNGGLNRSDTGGVGFVGIHDIPEDGPWVTPYVLDHGIPGRMVTGFNNIWASDTRGDVWYQLTFWDTEQSVRCIGLAPSDGYYIYVARNDRVERSLDGGVTWTNIRPGLPNLSPTSFAVDHDDPLHVWITYSGTSFGNKVYETVDGGETWANRSLNMPNVPVNSIVVQPNSPDGLYAATDIGVFYHDDYTTGWEPYGIGMPNVVVSELEINMAAGKLRAATFGRGILETDLFYSPFASVQPVIAPDAPRLLALDKHGSFLVRSNATAGNLISVHVVDAMGRVLEAHAPKGQLEMQVDLADRSAGTYAVVIVTEGGTWCRRVVR